MVDLDLVEEVKHEARIQEEVWKRRVTGKLKSKLRKRKFIAGDLVWRIIGDAQKDHLKGKAFTELGRSISSSWTIA